MSAKLRLKCQDKQKLEWPRRQQSLRHIHLDETCKKQKESRSRRKDSNARKTKIGPAVKLPEKNVVEVIQSLSGSSGSSGKNSKGERKPPTGKESEDSIIYVGTTYLQTEKPGKESIVDLTGSDTTIISWANNYNLDNYDISGDNVVDELNLKDHVSSAASIFTIFPPQPRNLFTSPSDELCVCQTSDASYLSSTTKKRNLSASDVTCHQSNNNPKRVASAKTRIAAERMIIDESSDCIWKLKKSYPLTTVLRENSGDSAENIDADLLSGIDIFDIVDDLDKEFNVSSQHSALTGDFNTLTLTSNVSNL